ncbi:hypothetical protein ACFL1R_09300 [Candidatus Latescibacterota bacterium]
MDTRVKITQMVDQSLVGYSGVVAKINEKYINRPQIILLYDKGKKKITPSVLDTSTFSNFEMNLIL